MNKEILRLRQDIDKIDNKIFGLLKKRFKITNKIMNEKKKVNFFIKDDKRERELINKEISKSRLNKKFVSEVYRLIFKESRRK